MINKQIPWKDIVRSDWYLWLLLALAFAAGVCLSPRLPDLIPTHFNINGEADGYSGKLFGVFFPLVMNLGVYLLMLFTPKLDPRGENYEKMRGTWNMVRAALVILFLIIWGAIMAVALGYQVDFGFFFPVLFSLFFMIFGNVLGRVKPNYFLGIRTPWTIESETVWRKTHRMAASLYVACGILGIILAFLGLGFWAFILIVLLGTVIPTVYSYIIYKKEKAGS